MSFVYPAFLFALAAIAVPVIIHLFNFRKYKRIYFSDTRFLKEVKEQTQSRSRLKHLLVLFCRILAITFLVFAFAQPFIPGSQTDVRHGNKVISIYIDNSFSMEAKGVNGPLLDVARARAKEIAKKYRPGDLFQLVTNDFEGYQQRLVSREEFMDMVDEIKPSAATRNLSEVASRQLDVINSEKDLTKRMVWISDFQKNTSDFEKINTDEKIVGIALKAEKKNNLSIDTCWFETPVRQLNAQEKLVVRIRNYSENEITGRELQLSINGKPKAIGNFSVAPNSYVDSTLYFTNTVAGIQNAMLSIPDEEVTNDNYWYFSYNVESEMKVLAIYPDGQKDTASSHINRLFRNDPFFKLKSVSVSGIDYSQLTVNGLVVLCGLPSVASGMTSELLNYVKAGGNVLFFPAVNGNINTYNEMLKPSNGITFTGMDTASHKTAPMELGIPFYANVFEKDPTNMDMPLIRQHYTTINNSLSRIEILLKLKNGDIFLGKTQYERGNFYVSTVPLDERAGNFSRHAIFVPVVLRIAEWSQNSTVRVQQIGMDEPIDVRNREISSETTYELKKEGSEISIVPEIRNVEGNISVYSHGQIKEAGNYTLMKGMEEILGVGYNYGRKESDLTCYEPEDVAEVAKEAGIKNFSVIDEGGNEGEMDIEAIDDTLEYWRYCIWLVLIFLALEILILRFWKT